MKKRIPTLLMAGALLGLWSCSDNGNHHHGDNENLGIVDCQWMSESPLLDSIAGCAPGNMKTRYLTTLRFHLDVDLPDDVPADADELKIAFDFNVESPGQLCGNGTPMNIVGWKADGSGATANVQAESCDQVRSPSVEVCGAVDLTLPIVSGQRSTAGGICIVLETIDPKSVYSPTLSGTFNWTAEIEGVNRDIETDNTPWTLSATYNSLPSAPSCAACTDPG